MKRVEIAVLLFVIGVLEQPIVAAEATKLPFDTYSGYCVSQKFELDAARSFVVITNQQQFDKVFPVVVENDQYNRIRQVPLIQVPKDAFKSKMVVATIKRDSAVWKFTVENVTVNDSMVTLRYTTKSKKGDTAIFACPLIVLIPKGDCKAVQFVENNRPLRKILLGEN